MTDQAVVHMGENSPEYIAYRLTRDIIGTIEGKKLSAITREEYLQTYGEALKVVRGFKY